MTAEELENIEEVRQLIIDFIARYERDMRGNTILNNGHSGIVGNLRDIKKYIKDYPSATWYFFKKPVGTVVAVILTHAALDLIQIPIRELITLLLSFL